MCVCLNGALISLQRCGPFIENNLLLMKIKMIKNSWYLSPAGWDSVKKINILSEHLKVILPEDRFEDHIVQPQLRKVKFIYYLLNVH